MNRSAIDRGEAERALKATTNVRRYSASGAIQKSGTGAMSVEKYVVTASIRLDGMNASAIHVARRSHVGRRAAADPQRAATGSRRRAGLARLAPPAGGDGEARREDEHAVADRPQSGSASAAAASAR